MRLAYGSGEHGLVWDRDLIARYDLTGPRYTSYPTAPQFHDEFGVAQLASAIARSNAWGRPLSLYFHIPFCSRVCYFCACNKIVTANRKRSPPYLERLFTELAMQAELFDSSRSVSQLHWGGGTPTFLDDNQIRQLMAEIRRNFGLLDDDRGEYSIELHPGDTNVETIRSLRDIGFNRLSMGVQDFHPQVQKAVNRFNSVEQVGELVEAARTERFKSISMDLIYGLPFQRRETFSRTLDHIIALGPDRLSVFNYAHMPHLFKTQNQIEARALPEPAEKLRMIESASEKLLAAGYLYIGMDHFAKPNDELAIAQQQGKLHRNFQGYATHGNCDMLGFGVSAIAAIDNVFAQNHKQIDRYYAAIDAGELPVARGIERTHDDQIRRQVIMSLICQFSLDFGKIERDFEICFADYFADELAALEGMEGDGLLTVGGKGIEVLPAGRLLIRRICMVFDAYAGAHRGNVRYSKII